MIKFKTLLIATCSAGLLVRPGIALELRDLKKEEVPGGAVFSGVTPHGVKLNMNYDLVVGAGIALSAVGAALQAGRNDQVDQELNAIVNSLADLRRLLVEIIDVLNNLGARIDASNRANTVEFIRTQLIAQAEILQTRLARFAVDKPYAKAEARRLLDTFEPPAFQIRQYGVSPFNADILAMLLLRTMYKYEDEPRNKEIRRTTWQQYVNYFKNQVLNPAESTSLTALLSANETNARDAHLATTTFQPVVRYASYHQGRCDYTLDIIFSGNINSGYSAQPSRQQVDCSEPRGGPGGGGHPFSLALDTVRTASGDAGWEQFMYQELGRRNGLRNQYLTSSANAVALKPMIELAKQAQAAAEAFVNDP
jgi:hypothetical protein